MNKNRLRKSLSIFVVLAFVFGQFSLVSAAAKKPPQSPPPPPGKQAVVETVVFFSADGMRPDLMERYVSEGVMPTYADMINQGD